MTIQNRRNQEKTELKTKIRNAAIEIINQDGYESLSLRKIAAKIEYSPTTIYLYYKDKAQIIKDMAGELYNRIEHNASAIIDEHASDAADRQVRLILLVFIDTLSHEPEMAKAIIYSGMNFIFANENNDPSPTNAGINMFDQLLDKGIAEGIFKPSISGSSWMIISALLGFVISAVENKLYLLDHFNQLADSFVELLLGGMKQ